MQRTRTTPPGRGAERQGERLMWLTPHRVFYAGLLAPALAGEHIPGDYLIWGMMPVAFMIAASTVTLVVVSLVTKPLPAATVDRYFGIGQKTA